MRKGFLTDNTCLHSQCWGMCLWDLILFTFRNTPSSNCLTYLPVGLMHNPCKVLCTSQSSVPPSCSWLLIKGADSFSLQLVLWLYCFSLILFLLLQHFSSLFLLCECAQSLLLSALPYLVSRRWIMPVAYFGWLNQTNIWCGSKMLVNPELLKRNPHRVTGNFSLMKTNSYKMYLKNNCCEIIQNNARHWCLKCCNFVHTNT